MTVGAYVDPRDTRARKNRNFKSRSIIDKAIGLMVDSTNDKIYMKFKELGMEYVPFQLVYNNRNVHAQGGAWKNVKNVTLEIDKKFIRSYFSKKIGFYSWLSNNYPDIKSQVVRGKEPNLKRYIKQFNKEVKWQDQKPMGKWKEKRPQGIKVNFIKESSEGMSGEKEWSGFTGRDLDTYLENEDFIFKGAEIDGDPKSVMAQYMERQSGKDNARIREVLKEILKQFNKNFLSIDLNSLNDEENLKQIEKTYENPDYQDHLKEKHAREERKTTHQKSWNSNQRFPNIKNIRDWFIKEGIYKSYKFDEFNSMKSIKQKKNFIDQSVFLIANGVFTKSQGKQSYKLTRDPETPNYAFRKYRETAGKKIRASTMRRRAGVEVRANRRKNKYDNWNKEVERMARGWKNRDRRRKTR